MYAAEDKNLQIAEHELRFIARKSQQIDGSYDMFDKINFAVVSALRALDGLKLSLKAAREASPAGVGLAA